MDDNITMSDPIPDGEKPVVNMGLQARHHICTGQAFDMIGGLHVNIFNQTVILLTV